VQDYQSLFNGAWENGQLKSAMIRSVIGTSCRARYKDKTVDKNLSPDLRYPECFEFLTDTFYARKGSPNGIRTRATSVRGRRANHYSMGPFVPS
jgi:hypothetical protein